jgi:hypothetical protein
MMTIDPEATYELTALEDDPEDRSYALTAAGARAVGAPVDAEAFGDRLVLWHPYLFPAAAGEAGRWIEVPYAV